MNVPVTFAPHPMARDIKQHVMQQGVTLAEIVCDVIPGAPWDSVVVHVNDWEAPHGSWHIVRPKSDGDRIVVTVSRRMHGGGGGGKKNVLSIVASVALITVATLATGGFFAVGGFFVGGSLSASLLAGAISILGQFAIRQLTAAPGKDGKGESPSAPQLGNAGGGGNTIDLGGPMIRCVGARKVFPKLVCEPLIDMIGTDEYIEAVYALAGAHAVTDLRIEGASAGDVPNLKYEITEGRNGQPAQRSVNRYGKTDPTQIQISGFRKEKIPSFQKIDPNFSLQDAAPQFHVRRSALNPDEIWMHLLWSEGIGGPTFPVFVTFRLRMREVGSSTWINLPELGFQNSLSGPIRKYIKLIFGGGAVADASYPNGAWESWHTTEKHPTQQPSGVVWVADTSFKNSATLNDTKNVERREDGFTVFLDPAVFLPGKQWEVGIKKSHLQYPSVFTASTYATGGTFYDFFAWSLISGSTVVNSGAEAFEYVPSACTMLRIVSVKNQSPTPLAGDAHITISGINLNVQQVSVMANGLVPDWNGTNWTGEVETSNPAPHLRYLFAGAMTARPVPADIIDNAEFVAWRARCATANIKISAAFEGMSLDEVATAIAAVGFGKPRRTDIYGVFHDYNTSSEAPVQVFSPRNANSIVFEKTFTDIPDAFLVRFADESLSYEPNEIVVLRPGVDPTGIANPPSVDATGITNAAQLAQNYTYVLNVMAKRGATVSFATNVQSILCRTGNVIGLSHPVISRHAMQGRVKQVKRNVGGLIAGLVLDDVVVFGGVADFMAITDTFGTDDVFATGVALAATAGLLNGTHITQNITWSGDEKNEITFSAPIADVGFAYDGEDKDILVIIGPATTMFARYKVSSIEPMGWFDARITALPEAPEIAVLPY